MLTWLKSLFGAAPQPTQRPTGNPVLEAELRLYEARRISRLQDLSRIERLEATEQ